MNDDVNIKSFIEQFNSASIVEIDISSLKGKIEKLLILLQDCPIWSETGSNDTQRSSGLTEGHFENCFNVIYGNEFDLFKLDSHSDPDFVAFNKHDGEKVKCYLNKENVTRMKINKAIEELGVFPIWFSIKSSKNGSPRVNDHPPEPNGRKIFVLFNKNAKQVNLILERDLASRQGIKDLALSKRFLEFRAEYSKMAKERDYGTNSLLQALSVKAKYTKNNSSLDDLASMFSK